MNTAFIDETLKKRHEFYSKAHYQVVEPDIDLDVLMKMIS